MGKFQSKHGECGPEREGRVAREEDERVSATHCPFPRPRVLRPRGSSSSLQAEREPRR